jgi:elongation factor P--(R)-beta-lysine ligase
MNTSLLRNRCIRTARSFFSERNILEVRTAKLVESPALEPYIDALRVSSRLTGRGWSLATSPEFSMKKIFAEELKASPEALGIYEISPAFRDDQPGKNHAPEFTLIEWYHENFGLSEILNQAGVLIATLGRCLGHNFGHELKIYPLEHLFKNHGLEFNFANPQSVIETYRLIHAKLPIHHNEMDCAIGCFNLLFDEVILPILRKERGLVAVTGYPSYLTALACIIDGVAQRGEIYFNGMEIANAYEEEFNAENASAYWQASNTIRERRGMPAHVIDTELLSALNTMENVAGIAVGLERVLQIFSPELRIG